MSWAVKAAAVEYLVGCCCWTDGATHRDAIALLRVLPELETTVFVVVAAVVGWGRMNLAASASRATGFQIP